MQIFFQDPEEIPLPPEEVRILELDVQPYPDNRRVKVFLHITPFQQRPNAELQIENSRGERVASVSVIETIDPRMEFTLHLREAEPGGQYTLLGVVFYTEDDQGEETDGDGQKAPPAAPPKITHSQETTTSFTLP
jgi:hypothetical protein